MPIEDACATEEEAYKAKLNESEAICLLALEALIDWINARAEAWDMCSYLGVLGGGWAGLIEDMEEEAKNALLDQLEQDIAECIDNQVIEQWSLYLDLEAECEVERDEARALLDEYEACLHALHEGIPFA